MGLSREYLINGVDDHDVNSYYNYMVRSVKILFEKMKIFKYFFYSVAELLGADRMTAEKELKESLEFEIKLAHASQV